MPKNVQRRFDQLQEQALGTYVYLLWDPRDRKVFYVGKGTGSRLFDHFNETERDPAKWNPKHRRISEIWNEDLDVRWHIVRRNLDKHGGQPDFDVEAAVIDALEISQNGMTLNEVRGQGVRTNGSLSEQEVTATAATPVNPAGHYPAVFLFPIQNALAEGRSIYDATRSAWPVSAAYQNLANALAVGIAGGITQGVFTINNWVLSETGNRYEFNGQELQGHELQNKSWLAVLGAARGFWQRGNYLVVEMNGSGQFRLLRGSQDRTTWLPLL